MTLPITDAPRSYATLQLTTIAGKTNPWFAIPTSGDSLTVVENTGANAAIVFVGAPESGAGRDMSTDGPLIPTSFRPPVASQSMTPVSNGFQIAAGGSAVFEPSIGESIVYACASNLATTLEIVGA